MISRLLLRLPRGPIWALMLATVALIVFAQHTPAHGQRADEEVVTVATRPGVKQAFLLVRPPSRPLATVVVLVGGTGQLDLTPRGLLNARGLFGPRRKQLAGQGLVVALVDAPSDRSAEGLLNFRTSGEHAIDLEAVIHWLRQREPAPVWLVGISMGTVSAANAAARLGPRGPDGLVLISSVTRTHPSMGESLGGVSLEKVTVPTLVIHHRNDPCETAPYDAASVLPARLAATRRAELITLEGGSPPRGLPCSAQSFHGFFGMEDVLMDRLASWIKRTLLP